MINEISTFINRSFENEINKKMLYYDYDFPKKDIHNYVNMILGLSVKDLVEYAILTETTENISAKDVFQFSNFLDGTENICNKLILINNPGVNFLQAGKLLLDDEQIRNNVAYNKYGENHLKLSESLGLTYELTHVYFVSCLGYIYVELEKDQQFNLLIRLILRNKFIQRLIKASSKAVLDLRQCLYMISDSTYIRRRSNIKYILKLLNNCKEYDFSHILNNVKI